MVVSETLGDIVSQKGAIPIFNIDTDTFPNLEKGMLGVNCFLRNSQTRAISMVTPCPDIGDKARSHRNHCVKGTAPVTDERH